MADPRWYYDARTGTIAQYPAAPDPGNWYRLIPYEDSPDSDPGRDVHETLMQGEYPLVTYQHPEALQQMAPQELMEHMQYLQRRDYEDPGKVFEANPEFVPGSPDRPAGAPPTSQAPPSRDFDRTARIRADMLQGITQLRAKQREILER